MSDAGVSRPCQLPRNPADRARAGRGAQLAPNWPPKALAQVRERLQASEKPLPAASWRAPAAGTALQGRVLWSLLVPPQLLPQSAAWNWLLRVEEPNAGLKQHRVLIKEDQCMQERGQTAGC